jgi:hypothetical protein
MMAYTKSVNTTAKMIPVMARTNRDRLVTDLAGVDAGAKMFVGFRGAGIAPTAVLTGQMTEPMSRRGSRPNELFDCPACIQSHSLSKFDSGESFQLMS